MKQTLASLDAKPWPTNPDLPAVLHSAKRTNLGGKSKVSRDSCCCTSSRILNTTIATSSSLRLLSHLLDDLEQRLVPGGIERGVSRLSQIDRSDPIRSPDKPKAPPEPRNARRITGGTKPGSQPVKGAQAWRLAGWIGAEQRVWAFSGWIN